MNIAPLPWTLAPLKGKYYGTVILDAEGEEICKLWLSADWQDIDASSPSPREYEAYCGGEGVCVGTDGWGGPCDHRDWYDSSHYENTLTYDTANAIVGVMNDR